MACEETSNGRTEVTRAATESVDAEKVAGLRELARRVRLRVVQTAHHTGAGHVAADLSATDVLSVLYGAVLDVAPDAWHDNDRDRLILSKSHASAALYSLLAERGFIDPDELLTFGQAGSRLCTAVSSHVPGVEVSTGALGHGLPFAVGAALAARMDRSTRRVVVVTGDGELQEGSNWEAAMLAGSRGLDNLTLVVDRNRVQKGASTEEINALEPLEAKWCAFGWSVRSVDGHDHGALLEVLRVTPFESGRPSCVLAETVKGRGVSFMENNLQWHSGRMSEAQFQDAVRELS